MKLSTDQDFILAKEMIVQGLAVRFGGSDQFASEDLKINTKKRLAQEYAETIAAEEMANNEFNQSMARRASELQEPELVDGAASVPP